MFPLIARWVPGLGVVFAALVVASYIVGSDLPGRDASDEAWVAFYADSGNRVQQEISFMLIGLAGLCFLQFLGSLRGALARAEGEPARITTAAIASGITFITLAVLAHVVGTTMSWAVSFYDENITVEPDTARLFAQLAFGLYVMSLFAAAGMALATAAVALWMRAFPAWLGWLSVVATIAGLLGIFELTGLVVLAWIVALSAYMTWPRASPAASEPGV